MKRQGAEPFEFFFHTHKIFRNGYESIFTYRQGFIKYGWIVSMDKWINWSKVFAPVTGNISYAHSVHTNQQMPRKILQNIIHILRIILHLYVKFYLQINYKQDSDTFLITQKTVRFIIFLWLKYNELEYETLITQKTVIFFCFDMCSTNRSKYLILLNFS